jgi:hypothetical protein
VYFHLDEHQCLNDVEMHRHFHDKNHGDILTLVMKYLVLEDVFSGSLLEWEAG